MTPNPNPSPELIALADIFEHFGNRKQAPSHSHIVPGVWDNDIGNGGKGGTPCEWCATWERARAALSPQTLPAPGEVEDVCAQCKGMRDDLTSGRDPEELCDPCYDDAVATLAASPTLATVAAANDEAFARGVEAAAKVADDLASIAERGKKHPHPLAIDTNEGWRRVEDACLDIADRIRALATSRSQHEGAGR